MVIIKKATHLDSNWRTNQYIWRYMVSWKCVSMDTDSACYVYMVSAFHVYFYTTTGPDSEVRGRGLAFLTGK